MRGVSLSQLERIKSTYDELERAVAEVDGLELTAFIDVEHYTLMEAIEEILGDKATRFIQDVHEYGIEHESLQHGGISYIWSQPQQLERS